ncbi:MAG: phosphoribosyltransferase, partial [Muribaculaceae bacterium]|nr:phosphoribosyltransferase [Muribaculaceae bacterium]
KRLRNSVEFWIKIKGIPFDYFWHYYSKSALNSNQNNRNKEIFEFKDGRPVSQIYDLLYAKLFETFNKEDLCELTFVCVPASSYFRNSRRYESFSNEVCKKTGMRNGYFHITIGEERTPKHSTSTHVTEDIGYFLDRNFFKGALIVLFDDIVTTGQSIYDIKEMLEAAGAEVICAISIGKTIKLKV